MIRDHIDQFLTEKLADKATATNWYWYFMYKLSDFTEIFAPRTKKNGKVR